MEFNIRWLIHLSFWPVMADISVVLGITASLLVFGLITPMFSPLFLNNITIWHFCLCLNTLTCLVLIWECSCIYGTLLLRCYLHSISHYQDYFNHVKREAQGQGGSTQLKYMSSEIYKQSSNWAWAKIRAGASGWSQELIFLFCSLCSALQVYFPCWTTFCSCSHQICQSLKEILGNWKYLYVISPSLISNFPKTLLTFPQVFDLDIH